MKPFLALLSLLLALSPLTGGAQNFFFKDGDRAVLMGDSITEQHLYSTYVELWTVTRFPAWNISFRNVGIGGDTSAGGNRRFRDHAIAYKATAMTVDFGMNDGRYKAFEESTFKPYMDGLQGIATQAKGAGIRMAWVTPQPLDGPEPGSTALTGYNQTLEKFSAGVQEIARKNDGLFVDQFHPYLATLDKARGAQQPYERITAGDAVHPGPPGQALMAASILKGLGFPTLVASVEIEAAGNGAAVAKNCTVSEVARAGGGIKFRQEDKALPFFPEEAKAILKWNPILEELNQYTLKVTGLKAGSYAVKLDGTVVATLSGESLGRGVNLAEAVLATGPIAAQVKAVKGAVQAKNSYHHDRIFRGVLLAPAAIPDWVTPKVTAQEIESMRQAAFQERMAKMPELDLAVKQALKIKSHQVEITPVP